MTKVVSTMDPLKDVQELYRELDNKFFQGEMAENGVILELTKKPCDGDSVGYCYELKDKVENKKRVYIVLNKPVLMLRKRIDTVETLLHEMIHALLYIRGIEEENGGHGSSFCRIMNNINKVAGTNITIYHDFYDETDLFKNVASPKPKKENNPQAGNKLQPGKVPRPILSPKVPAMVHKPYYNQPLLKPLPANVMKGYGDREKRIREFQCKTIHRIRSSFEENRPNAEIKLIGYGFDRNLDLFDDFDYGNQPDPKWDNLFDVKCDYREFVYRMASRR